MGNIFKNITAHFNMCKVSTDLKNFENTSIEYCINSGLRDAIKSVWDDLELLVDFYTVMLRSVQTLTFYYTVTFMVSTDRNF